MFPVNSFRVILLFSSHTCCSGNGQIKWRSIISLCWPTYRGIKFAGFVSENPSFFFWLICRCPFLVHSTVPVYVNSKCACYLFMWPRPPLISFGCRIVSALKGFQLAEQTVLTSFCCWKGNWISNVGCRWPS